MPYSRIAIVTGANKGIGFAIVRRLALEYSSSPLNNGRLLIYLTARNKARGEGATRKIYADPELIEKAQLTSNSGLIEVKYHPLDIADSQSIRAFGNFLAQEHSDGIDIAINNAGIAKDGPSKSMKSCLPASALGESCDQYCEYRLTRVQFGADPEIAREVLQCNYFGTVEASQTFLDHLRPGGRLINIASMLGKINRYPDSLQAEFRAAAAQESPEATDSLIKDYLAAVAESSEADRSWPNAAAYSVSKAGCIAMTKALANRERNRKSGISVNAVCPGWIKTDLTHGRGVGTPDLGAATPVKLSLSDSKTTGEFWSSGKVYDW